MTHDQMVKAEYIEWLKQWIVKQHAAYTKSAEHAKGTPLRHPNGQSHPRHTVEYLWSDALWCQDITTTTCPEEYCLGKYDEEYEWEDDDEACEWLNKCFDIAFRAVMPKNLHHVLEG